MRIMRTILRHVERMPRGFAADGRVLGLATSAAIETARQRGARGGPRPEPTHADERPLADARG